MKPTAKEFFDWGMEAMKAFTFGQKWLNIQAKVNQIGLAGIDPAKAEYFPIYHVRELLGYCQAYVELYERARQEAAVNKLRALVDAGEWNSPVDEATAVHDLFRFTNYGYNELTGEWEYMAPDTDSGDDPPERESDAVFYAAQGYPDCD